MNSDNFKSFVEIVILLLIAVCWPGTANAQREDTASYLRPEHREIVEHWLARRPGLRLATDGDTNQDGLAQTRKEKGKNYHPYYAVGDFNGDGKEDFAVAFKKKRKSKLPFTVAIFNGPLAGNSVPAFTTDDDLRSGGLFYNSKAKPREGRLIVGVFESDDCVILLPRGLAFEL